MTAEEFIAQKTFRCAKLSAFITPDYCRARQAKRMRQKNEYGQAYLQDLCDLDAYCTQGNCPHRK